MNELNVYLRGFGFDPTHGLNGMGQKSTDILVAKGHIIMVMRFRNEVVTNTDNNKSLFLTRYGVMVTQQPSLFLLSGVIKLE